MNKEKCNAWIDIALAMIRLSKELTTDECDYIKAQCMIIQGKIEMERLENKNEI